jgi:hypothetical protein
MLHGKRGGEISISDKGKNRAIIEKKNWASSLLKIPRRL